MWSLNLLQFLLLEIYSTMKYNFGFGKFENSYMFSNEEHAKILKFLVTEFGSWILLSFSYVDMTFTDALTGVYL